MKNIPVNLIRFGMTLLDYKKGEEKKRGGCRRMFLLSKYLFQLGLLLLIQVMLTDIHEMVHVVGCAVAEEVCKIILQKRKTENA
jgi:hypothetical protein